MLIFTYYSGKHQQSISDTINVNDQMRQYMQTIDWELLIKDKTAEEFWETLNKHMHESLQKYVPKVKHWLHGQRKPLWMTERT